MPPNSENLDLNFCFPIDASKLKNEKLSLVPFDTNLEVFAQHYVSGTINSEAGIANFKYLPYGPFQTKDVFLEWYKANMQPNNGTCWFAIIVSEAGMRLLGREPANDDGKGGTFAGNIGFLNADAQAASCEIGHINILPPFQRTFVGSNANGLLLHYLLDPISSGCLGIRRVQWFANASNEPSVNAAKRLGFQMEGILRWHRILQHGKVGQDSGDGRGPGRHSALLSLCWDDWNDGGREKVRGLMDR